VRSLNLSAQSLEANLDRRARVVCDIPGNIAGNQQKYRVIFVSVQSRSCE
jgi:hypothetical protein